MGRGAGKRHDGFVRRRREFVLARALASLGAGASSFRRGPSLRSAPPRVRSGAAPWLRPAPPRVRLGAGASSFRRAGWGAGRRSGPEFSANSPQGAVGFVRRRREFVLAQALASLG